MHAIRVQSISHHLLAGKEMPMHKRSTLDAVAVLEKTCEALDSLREAHDIAIEADLRTAAQILERTIETVAAAIDTVHDDCKAEAEAPLQ